jgi:hypothetical protein
MPRLTSSPPGGGRVSVFEPIHVLMAGRDPDRFFGYDVGPVAT